MHAVTKSKGNFSRGSILSYAHYQDYPNFKKHLIFSKNLESVVKLN